MTVLDGPQNLLRVGSALGNQWHNRNLTVIKASLFTTPVSLKLCTLSNNVILS